MRRRLRVDVDAVGYPAGDGPGIGVLAGKVHQHRGVSGSSGTDHRDVQRQWTAMLSSSDCLHVELSRLLCDDRSSGGGQDGAVKNQDSRGVDGWTASGLDAGSRMRQESRGSAGLARLRTYWLTSGEMYLSLHDCHLIVGHTRSVC